MNLTLWELQVETWELIYVVKDISDLCTWHSSVLELRKNQFLKIINVLKTFLEIETTHYLEGLDLKLNNETYATHCYCSEFGKKLPG